MPTLHERFADLAEDAPQTPTPPELWASGRRRARQSRIGTGIVVVATLALLALVAGVAGSRSAAPQYVGRPGTTVALPTEIHHPSPWLPGTGATPPGRLSMVIPAKRGGWRHYHWGAVGVSASTGTYRYLDIPGCVQFQGLSPDGTRVSCFTGSGSGTHEVLEGIEVYSTQTGHVYRWDPGRGRLALNTVAWSGSRTLTMRAGGTSYEWRFGYGDPRPISTHLGDTAGTAGQAGLYPSGPRSYFYLDPARSGRRVDVRLVRPPARHPFVAVSPSGRRVASTRYDGARVVSGGLPRIDNRLYVGSVQGPDRRATLRPLATSLHWPTIVGWADDQHLLVVDQVSPTDHFALGDPGTTLALERVDVTTGAVTRLAGMADQGGTWVTFAQSLLGAPVRDFPPPPAPMDPRLEAGLVAGAVLAGGVALFLWRRLVWRRRARA